MNIAEIHTPWGKPEAADGRCTRILTVLAAVVAALVVWLVAGSIAGAGLNVRSGDATQHIGPVAVVVVSALAGLVAWALAAVTPRFTSRPRLVWTVFAAVVLALSLNGPLILGIGAGTTVALTCMHLAVGVVLIPGLARTIPYRSVR